MTRHLWDKRTRRTLGVAIIAGLAAALAGVGVARAQTPITSCGYDITAPGSYVLAADIGPCSGNGINVKVSNVNLALNGYSITGPGPSNGTGINICALSGGVCSPTARISNINIRGLGLLQQFANGIYLQNVDSTQIQNVFASFNKFGMISSNCTKLQFNANVATRNALEGFVLFGDSNDQVQQNRVNGNDTSLNVRSGIALVGGSGHQVNNNDSDANSCHGIYVDSSNSQIQNNTASGNGNTNPACSGIYVETGASGNVIQNNTAGGNKTYDVEDANTSCGSNKWHNNTFFTNNQACVQ